MTETIKNIAMLAENAKTGDSIAVDRLIRHYHKDIFNMVYYRTGSKMDAEDITQDVFVKVVKNLNNLRDASVFKTWLYRIALNKVNDFYRKKKLRSFFMVAKEPEEINEAALSHPTPEDSETPDATLMKKEFYDALFTFTKTLSKNEKDIFLLRFVDQLTIGDIGKALNKHESTVKTHLYRSISKFKTNKAFRRVVRGAEI